MRWSTLTAVAGGTTVALLSMLKLLDKRNEDFLNNSAFIDSAVRILKSKPQVVRMFGNELEVGRPTFHDGWSKMGYLWVQFRIPVKGTEDKGAMYTYAKKLCKESPLRLYKLEVTFDKIEGKRLLLLDLSDEQLKKLDEAEQKPQQKVEKVTPNSNEVNKSDYNKMRLQRALAERQAAEAESSKTEKN